MHVLRPCRRHDFATLKVYTREGVDEEEFNIYQTLRRGNSSHPGFPHVRTALDLFNISRPGGDHKCLVQKPMWDSFRDLLNRNPSHRFTEELLKAGLAQIFLGLSYLHNECKLVHTGKLIEDEIVTQSDPMQISKPTTF
jgi:serine/threonine-protein kinase SRPK3